MKPSWSDTIFASPLRGSVKYFLQFLLPEAKGMVCSSGGMGASGAKKKCTEVEELQNLWK